LIQIVRWWNLNQPYAIVYKMIGQ